VPGQKRFETFNSTMNSRPLILDILITLYQVGIIGVKLTPQDHTIYIHESFSALRESDINTDTAKFVIHPMFYKALRVKV
jgi:hypothetical protein